MLLHYLKKQKKKKNNTKNGLLFCDGTIFCFLVFRSIRNFHFLLRFGRFSLHSRSLSTVKNWIDAETKRMATRFHRRKLSSLFFAFHFSFMNFDSAKWWSDCATWVQPLPDGIGNSSTTETRSSSRSLPSCESTTDDEKRNHKILSGCREKCAAFYFYGFVSRAQKKSNENSKKFWRRWCVVWQACLRHEFSLFAFTSVPLQRPTASRHDFPFWSGKRHPMSFDRWRLFNHSNVDLWVKRTLSHLIM